jgi:hypothetical protein
VCVIEYYYDLCQSLNFDKGENQNTDDVRFRIGFTVGYVLNVSERDAQTA